MKTILIKNNSFRMKEIQTLFYCIALCYGKHIRDEVVNKNQVLLQFMKS